MTKMELLNAIVTGAEVTEEMQAKAKEWAETLAKRSSKPTKAQVANDALKGEMLVFLANAHTATEVAENFGISNQKASALLTSMVKGGIVERFVEKRKAYFKAVA